MDAARGLTWDWPEPDFSEEVHGRSNTMSRSQKVISGFVSSGL